MSHVLDNIASGVEPSPVHHTLNLVVEVQERENKQLQKMQLNHTGNMTIGRAWQSDIIVQDECVDASHLALSLADNGRLLLADLDSENGVFVNHKRVKNTVEYQFGDLIRLGGTTLRVFDASEQVKPALPVSVWQSWSRRLSSKQTISVATVLVIIGFLLQALLAQGQEFRLSAFLPTVFGAGFFLFVWSLLMSFVGRLFRHEANAKAHWSFGCLLIVIGIVVGFLLEIIDFNAPSPLLGDINESLLSGALIATLVYGTLSLTSFLTHRTKLIWAILLAILPAMAFFIMPLFDEEHEQWSAWVQTENFAMPPALLFRQGQPLERYIDDTGELFDDLFEQVKEVESSL